MKKQLAIVSLLSVAAVSMFATSADAKVFDKDKTDVGIQFKTDDPTTPGENRPYKDNLSLIWKPGNFNFGEQKAITGSAIFDSVQTEPQYLVVNDDRKTETLPKWTLSANMSNLNAGTDKLEGAFITFTLSDLKAYDMGTIAEGANDFDPKNPNEDPTTLSALDGTVASEYTLGDGAKKAVKLVAGDTSLVPVLAKKADSKTKGGIATTTTALKLTIPAQASSVAGKQFEGSVTWSLDDAPK